jgi:DNA-binding response OmpR family regulator
LLPTWLQPQGDDVRLLLAFPESDVRRAVHHAAAAWHPEVLCGVAGTAGQAADLVAKLRWHAVLVSARLGEPGLDATLRRLRVLAPETPIIVVTDTMSPAEALDVANAGAAAYVDLTTLDALVSVLQRFDDRTPRPVGRVHTPPPPPAPPQGDCYGEVIRPPIIRSGTPRSAAP